MKVVIMAGGRGTRFWPWSIKEKPKQFLPLMSNKSILQQTYNRFIQWLPPEKIFIVTSEEYISLVKEQIPFIKTENIIIEPLQRDTGPCIALTALNFLNSGDDEVFAAVPADHYIPDDKALRETFKMAEKTAEVDFSIVTIGVKPTRPDPGYGYILTEKKGIENHSVLPVKAFIEKPSMEKAEQLLKNQNVYWNSGIFLWKPSTIHYYMEKFYSKTWKKFTESKSITKELYSLLPKISVDYAILERAESISTIPVNFLWDDIGNWSSWHRLNENTIEDNLVQGDIHLLDTKNSIVKSEDRKTVVIGVEDLIIACTKEGLLVCHKSLEQKIKDVLNSMEETDHVSKENKPPEI